MVLSGDLHLKFIYDFFVKIRSKTHQNKSKTAYVNALVDNLYLKENPHITGS
jgi:hypothetical protein